MTARQWIWAITGTIAAHLLITPYVLSRPLGRCEASWYGPGFYGRRTANGEIYTGNTLTAAHKSLPFGTRVRITDVNTGRSVVVRINDRGPFIPGRCIDLSPAARDALGMPGLAPVRLDLI